MSICICCLPRLAVDDSDSDADNVEMKLLRDADYNSDNLDMSLIPTKSRTVVFVCSRCTFGNEIL